MGSDDVAGGSKFGKGRNVNAGDLPEQEAERLPVGVRVAIVAEKPGNAGGAKGDREANASSEGNREEPPSRVPETDKQEGEIWRQCVGIKHGIWSEKMLMALERGVKGNKWFSLIDKIYSERTLGLAWEQVSKNAGACGVDGMTVEHFAKDSQSRLLAVKEQIKRGHYQPKPVKRVWIPKPGSAEKRPLGIPTVKDRVVQAAVRMVIEPIFEKRFAPQSYGFRPGCSCKDALRRVDELLKDSYVHVVDIDIKAYFDAIPHEKLMEKVEEEIADGRVLELIEKLLKTGIMEEMREWTAERGTPQGGVISPLLANIYLNPLDWIIKEAGMEMVRYADDMVILCKEPEEAQKALEKVKQWSEKAGLTLHPGKTKVVDMTEARAYVDFLGYRFWRSRRGGLRRFIRDKSQTKLKERLKVHTKRANGHSMEAIIAKINPMLKGWYGYFKHACANALEDIDGWVRGRLRSILRKRRKGKGRGRGADHKRWRNSYFERLGLYCLVEARAAELISLRTGANC